MQTRNVYITIAFVFVLILGIIFFLESRRLSSEDVNATVDARVALILTEQDYSGTSQAQIEVALTEQDYSGTSQAQIEVALTEQGYSGTSQAQINLALTQQNFGLTAEAQRPIVLTDVALAYPSETYTPSITPTFTPTMTYTPRPTLTASPTFTPSPTRTPTITPIPSPTSAPEQLRNVRYTVLEDIGSANLLSVSSVEDYFAVTNGHNLQVYSILDFTAIKHYESGSDFVQLEWSPNRDEIATVNTDGMLELWDVDVDEAQMQINLDTSAISDLIWSPDGDLLITAQDSRIRFWNRSAELVDEVEVNTTPLIAWGSQNSPLLIADDTGVYTRLFQSSNVRAVFNAVFPVYALAFSSNGRDFALATEHEIAIRTLNVAQPNLRLQIHDRVLNLDWQEEDNLLVASQENNLLRIWNTRTGELVEELQHDNPILNAEWSNYRSRLFVLSEFVYVVEIR